MKSTWSLAVLLTASAALQAQAPIRVMILDGEQAGTYHDWQHTTPALRRMLLDARIFAVDVVTAHPQGGDFTRFQPDWSRYQVVVLNYDAPDERWPDTLKASFEQYVRGGGNLVSYHAADNAFPHWKAFNLMIGVGGWRGRNQHAGPHFFFQDGQLASDTAPGNAGTHGDRLPFLVTARVADHPITRGLPQQWMHAGDELYANLRGPGENMTVLATAYSDPANQGSGRDEPVLLVLTYGNGRIFHTTLGHDVAALGCVGFIATFQRGVEWAATGSVTQPPPTDFPTAGRVSTRPR